MVKLKILVIFIALVLVCLFLCFNLYPQLWINYKIHQEFGSQKFAYLNIQPIPKKIYSYNSPGYKYFHEKIFFELPWKATTRKTIGENEVFRFNNHKAIALFDHNEIFHINNFKKELPKDYKWLTGFYGVKKLESTYFLYSEVINSSPSQITYAISGKEALAKFALIRSKSVLLSTVKSNVYSFNTSSIKGYLFSQNKHIIIEFWGKKSETHYALVLPKELEGQPIIDAIILSIGEK